MKKVVFRPSEKALLSNLTKVIFIEVLSADLFFLDRMKYFEFTMMILKMAKRLQELEDSGSAGEIFGFEVSYSEVFVFHELDEVGAVGSEDRVFGKCRGKCRLHYARLKVIQFLWKDKGQFKPRYFSLF